MYDTYIVVESGGVLGEVTKIDLTTMRVADADGDGLIEIGTLAELNNVRYSLDGTGYKTSTSATPVTRGCPNGVCRGYELTADLDFDTDDDGTWTRNSDGSYALDTDDDNSAYFDIASDGSSGGWVPIGDCGADSLCEDDDETPADETLDNAPFTAVFDGGGYTISGLATARDLLYIGLFGVIDTGADIRNLGLVGNLAKYTGNPSGRIINFVQIGGLVGVQHGGSITASYATGDANGSSSSGDEVGGLVGRQSGGSITASHAIGDADGGAGASDDVGGLVGLQFGGSITASYAAGDADGGDGALDSVGGLVGLQGGGSITASHATGNVGGGDGDFDDVGGLVGLQGGGSIAASYAAGDVDGGVGDSDRAGGLVGVQHGGSIAASYAAGDADGGVGDSDRAGGLVGYRFGADGTITASWGFGNLAGQELDGSDGSSDLPAGITSASGLTSANVPASWNAAASSTLGAWDLGTATQAPALSYADYDGAPVGTAGAYTSGHLFHCASDSANAPADAVLVPDCGALIPSVVAANVLTTRADINVISGTAGTAYVAVLADGAMAPTAAAIKAATAGSGGVVAVGNSAVTASTRATVSLTGLMESSMYDAYIVVESGGVHGSVTKVNVKTRAIVSVANVMSTATDINVISGTAGTAYIVALADGAAMPTAAVIKAAVAGSEGVVAAGNSAVIAGTRATVSLTGLTASTMYDVYMVVESGGVLGTVTKIDFDTLRIADADGNGLIEIGTLAELNNVRHNLAGTGYQDGPGTATSTSGCPVGGCQGYELTADLDFDTDDDGTWTRNSDGSITLDADDDNDTYFDIASDGSSGGWAPIGDAGSRFTAVFDGGGHTISGLATVRNRDYIGLFGTIGSGADIRNLGLVDNLAKRVGTDSAAVGGLVGGQLGGSITASHASGRVEGDIGLRKLVGGLVGWQSGGSITASRATGDAVGGGGFNDFVGGLVGYQSGFGSIIASYAAGDVDGGGGDQSLVGGLVGIQFGGSITASYAIGDADGGAGSDDFAGGLIGASSSITITASWGFGSATGETIGIAGSTDSSGNSDRPNGVTSATGLTATNVPASWNAATSNTMGAWDFGTSSQSPALNYADYDGPTVGTAGVLHQRDIMFHCASDADNAPDDAVLISNCGTLIPGIFVANVLTTTADITVLSGRAGTVYVAVLADGAMVPTAAAIKAAMAGSGGVVAVGSATVASGRATVSLTGLAESGMHDAYIVIESGGVLGTVMKIDVDTFKLVDADGDGLIEIDTLAELNNVRYNLAGTGYKDGPGAATSTAGCPARVCRGYELTTNLDFDADGDGSTWTRNSDGSVTLDADDNNDTYFDIASGGSSGGWVPIGDFAGRFTAVFDGGGHTISGLATVRDLTYIGLFGAIDTGADIRNLGLVDNLAKKAGTGTSAVSAGGLVGYQWGGSITASYAAGDTDGGAGSNDNIGGLVGRQDGGSITASYATGDADGGTGIADYVGGLVGLQGNGSITASHATGAVSGSDSLSAAVGGLVGQQFRGFITASYATGDADGGDGEDLVGGLAGYSSGTITASYATGDTDGGAGSNDDVGGLVGQQWTTGFITASYASGDVDGGAGSDSVGGLVGVQWGSITASYASGDVDGGAGSDSVGGLVGHQQGSSNSITASWGFGSATGETAGIDGSTRPNGVTSATELTATNVPASWNEAASNTLGAWNFGTSSEPPALNRADYDGATMGTPDAYTSGHKFHCANDAANVPEGVVIIPNCGMPHPVAAVNVMATTVDINVLSGTSGTAYIVALANGAMAPTAAAIKAAVAGSGGVVAAGNSAATAGTRATVSLTGLTASTMYDVYMVVDSDGVLGTVTKIDLDTPRVADADGDGLIEIGTLAELNNVRYSLDGTGYKTSASTTPLTSGCPNDVCWGYELTTDLDFDVDGDGSTWTRNSDGSVTLDVDDNNDTYFDIASDGSSGGWGPIGDNSSDSDSTRFTAVFEGNGRTITGFATVRDLDYIGLFGAIGADADIRNIGLVGNLAKKAGTGSTNVGGLVGYQFGGSITASHATGDADGGDGDYDRVGGLVGYQNGGTITASYADGDADGGDGDYDYVGGLVGYQTGGIITASYTTGDVDGGAGDRDYAGSLVGYQTGGTITASYATGNADGGAGDDDWVGGLVGQLGGGTITASWGFGIAGRGFVSVAGSNDRPSGVTSVTDLTSANVPASWNEAASNTLGAWDFGTSIQPPVLNYADYDGATVGTAGSYTSGHRFHCASDSDKAPDDAVLIPNCGALIPGTAVSNVLATRADITVIGGAGTAYMSPSWQTGPMAPTAAAIKDCYGRVGWRGRCRQRDCGLWSGNRQPDGTHGEWHARCLHRR